MEQQTLPALRSAAFEARHILVTGANGYVGSLVVASLLRDTAARITCLVRPGHTREAVLAPVIAEWQQQSQARWTATLAQRVDIRLLPADLADLPEQAGEFAGVDEIVHAAGCLDYNDGARLRAANVVYTAHLMLLARRLKVARVLYVSTAFAAGHGSGEIAESRLPEPASDPTVYTRTKREGERIVAASGLPFIVLRPAILVGRSSDGVYTGKRYGLVQQWASLEELVCERWHADFHVVANEAPVHLLHQDAFCATFKAAHRWLPDGSHMNLVSDRSAAPSLRQLWSLWFELTQPERVHAHAAVDVVPLRQIPLRQRAYLSFAKVNLGIAAHDWSFQTRWLAALRARGLVFDDATLDSVRRCQDRHVEGSPRIADFRARHAATLQARADAGGPRWAVWGGPAISAPAASSPPRRIERRTHRRAAA